LGFFPKSGPKVFSLLRREKKYSRCVNIFCVLKLYRTWCHSMAVCDRLVTLNFIWHTDHLLRLRVYLFVCLNSQHFLFLTRYDFVGLKCNVNNGSEIHPPEYLHFLYHPKRLCLCLSTCTRYYFLRF